MGWQWSESGREARRGEIGGGQFHAVNGMLAASGESTVNGESESRHEIGAVSSLERAVPSSNAFAGIQFATRKLPCAGKIPVHLRAPQKQPTARFITNDRANGEAPKAWRRRAGSPGLRGNSLPGVLIRA